MSYLDAEGFLTQGADVAEGGAQPAVARPRDPGALAHRGGGAPLSLPPADGLGVHFARDIVPLPLCGRRQCESSSKFLSFPIFFYSG